MVRKIIKRRLGSIFLAPDALNNGEYRIRKENNNYNLIFANDF